MGKAKRSKNADAVHDKKSNANTNHNPFANATATAMRKINPFEVHMNREKFHVAGRICKHDKGLPGVSRSKALKKRQETLGKEYMGKHKSNRFRDRRIGKHLAELTEDVMNARFLADKHAQLKESKASRFNLNEDEVLTHRGQTLEEIEQFHDERSDDEAADDDLEAEFTEAAHFGGDADNQKDRKTAIEEMIVEQKKRKMETAREKEELHGMTEKLDASYKNIIGLMSKITNKEMKQKPPADDYDKLMREMIFEPRGAVSDKLISEEEMARREKERLQKLEEERLERMMDDDELQTKKVPKHRSADALDDDYYVYETVEETPTLAYKFDDNNEAENDTNEQITPDEEILESSDDEDDDDDDEESESDDESEDNLSDLKDSESEQEKDDADEEKSNMDTQSADNSESEEEKDQEDKEIKKEQSKAKKSSSASEENSKLPFTIDMPTSYKEFLQLLRKHKPEEQSILIERLIKCNHPKLDGVNREKIVKIFAFLLQYINELFSDASELNVGNNFKILDKLNPHLFDLVHLNPERMSETFLKVLQEKYAAYRKQEKSYPSLDTLVFLKLVSNLYTTSDFRHPIVTPSYIFIQHILSKARVRTRQDIASGLFLVSLVLEYSQLSKRFLPAAFNFLLGTLFLSIPKRPIAVYKIVPPFTNSGYFGSLLAIGDSGEAKNLTAELLKSEDLVMTTISIDFKVRAINMSLKLIEEAIGIVGANVGANYLAINILDMLDRLVLEPYPEFVQQSFEKARVAAEIIANKTLTKIVPPAKRPASIKFYEPRIVEVRDDKRRPEMSREKEEKVKLIHRVKRETKGALREIRRDTQYLQNMRLQQQIESDMERKEKVRRIYHEAAAQQGELNELDRLKKRKKF